jgi:pyruvate formate lyase activating enzyme
MIAAGFCHQLSRGVVQCDLCHHFCRIAPGRSGLCRVRKNLEGRLYSLNFGYPVASNVDPVEKKPLYHFMPGSWTFSFGTVGCNFFCGNCQNWEISQASPAEPAGPPVPPEALVQEALKAGCPSIACTYTEPTIFAEYGIAVMKEARKRGLKTIWVSNGYMSTGCLESIEPWLDAVNIDLKSMDDDFYRQVCRATLPPVLGNLRRLARSTVHLEVTTLLIPGHSDSPDMLEALAIFISGELGPDTPWHIGTFYPSISRNMTDLAQTSAKTVETAYLLGKKAGLSYIYGGASHNDTICPRCGANVIERHRFNQWHNIIRSDVYNRCPTCSAPANIKE